MGRQEYGHLGCSGQLHLVLDAVLHDVYGLVLNVPRHSHSRLCNHVPVALLSLVSSQLLPKGFTAQNKRASYYNFDNGPPLLSALVPTSLLLHQIILHGKETRRQ